MSKFLFGFVLAFSTNAFALPLATSPRANVKVPGVSLTGYNFEGIVALDDCSGSIVRLENSKDSDFAMVFTNGHCYEGGFIDYGKWVMNQSSRRNFDVLDTASNSLGTVHATKVIYATMTKTDLTVYQLKETYADILSKFQTHALTLSSQHPAVGQPIEIISGYWQRGYACQIEAFVNSLKEGDWTWSDSIRYSRPGCDVIGGTSGSPVILSGTRTMIGINNTGNENGQRCTDNNPCEIDKDGNITYTKGFNYAEETYWLYSCVNAQNQIDMSTTGCVLPH